MKRKFDISPEALAEELLGRPFEELDADEQRALCRVASTEIELDPDELEVADMKFGDRAADREAPIILMSQNRQAKKDRITNRHDYEVNLRTTVEILRLSRKLDRMAHFAVREAKKAEETIEVVVAEVRKSN